MIEVLLSDRVIAVEAFTDIPGEPPFLGGEDLVANAVEVRRREFVTARRCARQALAVLGPPAAPIQAGARREPIWPAAVVGSITHCAGYRAAAVARRLDLAGLGIDAEPHERLPEGIEESVTVPSECAHMRQLGDHHPAVRWDRLLFSAKESRSTRRGTR